MTDIDALLVAADKGDLTVVPLVVLDWYDGPLEGFAEILGDERCWHFKLVASRFRADDLDDRVFVFAELPVEVSATIRGVRDEPVPEQAIVQRALAAAEPPSLLVQAASFDNVKAVWLIA